MMNLYGKLAAYFITNKKLSVLVVLGITLWGILAFILMPKQYNPDITAPAFAIEAAFPGATVDEVYHIVTKPLEDVVSEIPEVEHIYGTSQHGGMSSVIVQFYVGSSLEKSIVSLQQKIASRLNLKPLGVGEPSICLIDPEDLPIKTIVLTSATLDAVSLRRKAFLLKDALRTVRGASGITVVGGKRREFKITLDPEKIRATKTSIDEIDAALNTTSLLQSVGRIKAKDQYFSVETSEAVSTNEDIENIIIASNVEARLCVKDVATVTQTEAETESDVHYYAKGRADQPAVCVVVAKKKGTNIVDVSARIDARIDEVKKRALLNECEVRVVKDEGRVASEEISRLVVNLMQAIAIVFLVLFAFLNYRAAVIVAISIPLTMLSVFAIGQLCGYTINRITLFALILSLGLLVDSATVVIENIVQRKKAFPDEDKAVLVVRAVSEVGVGLFLSTLTTVIAFIPMCFVTGMMGPYMGPLPFFVSMALLTSLLFAYTLNPWFAYLFCTDVAPTLTQKCGVVCRMTTGIMNGYASVVKGLLENRTRRRGVLILSVVLLCVVLLFPVLGILRFRMLPKADREQMFVYLDLARGTSFERTDRITQDLSRVLRDAPSVTSVQAFVGEAPILDFNGLFKGAEKRRGPHQATLKLNLSHPDERTETSAQLAVHYRTIMHEVLKDISDAHIQVIEDPPGPPVAATFHVRIKGSDAALIERVAYDLLPKAGKIKGVADLDHSMLETHTKYVISVDTQAASEAKVSVASISSELAKLFRGDMIGVYHSDYNDEQEYITVRFDRALRDEIEDLSHVYISNKLGNHVPLKKYVRMKSVPEDDMILSDDREQVVYLFGEMEKRSVTYAALDMLALLSRYEVPGEHVVSKRMTPLSAQYQLERGETLTIEIGGEWELTVKVFRDLGMAMACAIILIYFVLVAQFKSFIVPLLILGTIPFSLIGVIPGFSLCFWLGGLYFSATSMIGVIALAGIVVNNAIIFIEHVMQHAGDHASLDSVLVAAGRARMRPIVLTSVTTILGSFTIMQDPVWSGLSWAIVWGLSISTILTLVLFPLLVKEFLGERWMKSVAG